MIKSHTLSQLFIEENRCDYEPATIGNIELAFRHFIEAVGNKEIDRIEAGDGQRFKSWCIERGLAKTSANMWLRAIRRVFNWAADDKGLLEVNPLIEVRQMKVTRKGITVYEDHEVFRMIRFAPGLRFKAIILCAWTTGLRRGELLNVTLDNVRGGFIHVEAKRRTRQSWSWEPKTKDIRKVPLVEQLAEWIEQLGSYYPFIGSHRYSYLLKLDDAGMLTDRQRKCPRDNIYRTLGRIQRKAFGRRIGDFHQFRRTYITNISELPEQVLMKLSGHKDRRTLTYYTAVRQSMYEQARLIVQDRIKNGSLVSTETLRKEVG